MRLTTGWGVGSRESVCEMRVCTLERDAMETNAVDVVISSFMLLMGPSCDRPQSYHLTSSHFSIKSINQPTKRQEGKEATNVRFVQTLVQVDGVVAGDDVGRLGSAFFTHL